MAHFSAKGSSLNRNCRERDEAPSLPYIVGITKDSRIANQHAGLENVMSRHRAARQSHKIGVTYYRIDQLQLDPKNPRFHDIKQVRKIARSIESFGFNVPILIDTNLKVIAGHGRLLACRELGWREVPVIRLEHLSEAQARAFMIADNRLTEIGSWDDRLLGEQLNELASLDLDFSLEVTGFEMAEIDLRIESVNSQSEEPDPADAIQNIISGPPISRPGDVWQLGRHRVYCGNALQPQSYRALLGNKNADLVFTDPPYNVPIDGHASGLGAVRHREFSMATGEMDTPQFIDFLERACRLLGQHSKSGAIHFVCMDWRHTGELLEAGRAVYTELKNICVWAKHNAGMGSFYRSQHELVFVFKNGKGTHKNNVQLGKYGRHRSNVWFYRGANDFGRGTDEGNLSAVHPTVKPVALVADAILDCSERGDVVLDPFLGSGTTVIAAERTGRCCFGIEMDPLYVDAIIHRWQAFTGDNAKHAAVGKTFDQLAMRDRKCEKESQGPIQSVIASRHSTRDSRKDAPVTRRGGQKSSRNLSKA